jgi:hypothetical protein
MSTERQVVRVEVDGVAQAKQAVKSLDADVRKLGDDAKRAEDAVGRTGGMMDRFKNGGLLTRQGLRLGPAQLGRGGVTFVGASQANFIVHMIEGTATAADKGVDLFDEYQAKGIGGAVTKARDILAEDAHAAAQRGLALGTAPIKVLSRIFGVKGEVFNAARDMYAKDIARFYGGQTQDLSAIEAGTRQIEAEIRKREQAQMDSVAKAEEHFAKAMQGLSKVRPVGFMFRHRSEYERYRQALHEKNEQYERMVKEELAKRGTKNIPGAGS